MESELLLYNITINHALHSADRQFESGLIWRASHINAFGINFKLMTWQMINLVRTAAKEVPNGP